MNATSLNTLEGQRRHYDEVRKRLWSTKPKPRPVVESAPVIDVKPIRAPQIPLWRQFEVDFDAHVVAYRIYKQIMEELAKEGEKYPILAPRKMVRDIVAEVLEKFPGVTFEDLCSVHRNERVTYPRQVAMYEVYKQRKDWSTIRIGMFFGGRNHTTVLNSIRKIADERGEGDGTYLKRKSAQRARYKKRAEAAKALKNAIGKRSKANTEPA